jgi:hypothetical protein
MIGVISLMFLVMWVLFIFSVNIEDDLFMFIASCGLLLLSTYTMVNGLEGVNSWVTQAFAVINIGVGMVGILGPVYSITDERGQDDGD